MKNLGLKTGGMAAVLVPVLVVVAASAASAANAGGGAPLPWETNLSTLADVLTGNTAKYISIIAIFVAGVALIFGEDLGHFAKRFLMIVIAIAFLTGASSFVATLVTGAHI